MAAASNTCAAPTDVLPKCAPPALIAPAAPRGRCRHQGGRAGPARSERGDRHAVTPIEVVTQLRVPRLRSDRRLRPDAPSSRKAPRARSALRLQCCAQGPSSCRAPSMPRVDAVFTWGRRQHREGWYSIRRAVLLVRERPSPHFATPLNLQPPRVRARRQR